MRTPHWHANANELTYCVSGTSAGVGARQLQQVRQSSSSARARCSTSTPARCTTSRTSATERRRVHHRVPQRTARGFRSGGLVRRDDRCRAGQHLRPGRRRISPRSAATPPTGSWPPAPVTRSCRRRRTSTTRTSSPSRRRARRSGSPSARPGSPALQYWPALKDLSMYSLRVREDGMREPHWHPITAEMGYVHAGAARMTVMEPGRQRWTPGTWHEGDVYFIPRAYPHHIEVVDAPEMHFAIFFDQPMPGDIGYRASISAYSTRGAGRDVQHAHRRPAELPVHQVRSADRQPGQPAGPTRGGRALTGQALPAGRSLPRGFGRVRTAGRG